MHINEALEFANNWSASSTSGVLAKEVNRLRRHRKALYGMIPNVADIPIAIWQEMHEEEEKKEMTVDQAIYNIRKLGPYASKEVTALIKEVNRLREQRKQLVGEVPIFRELPKETLDILDEVDIEKQEGEKEMTVDLAISRAEENCAPGSTCITLATEVKRLRETVEIRDERIGELRTALKSATGKLSKIRAMA